MRFMYMRYTLSGIFMLYIDIDIVNIDISFLCYSNIYYIFNESDSDLYSFLCLFMWRAKRKENTVITIGKLNLGKVKIDHKKDL